MASGKSGRISRVAGPVVTAEGVSPRMYDVVLVGELKLMGEVIKLVGDKTVIQVYEDTSGIRPGEAVVDTGAPLQVELGPGLLSSIYDGVQRPLPVLMAKQGDFVSRGVTAPGLDRSKKWKFKPTVKKGDDLHGGMVVGEVPEGNIVHKVLLPPGVDGKVTDISEGEFTVEERVGSLDTGHAIKLAHNWPVRSPRPYLEKLLPDIPLVTGQRVLDTLFPLAKGGTAAIPGGFGTGKTVTSQQLSKWSDAQIVVYVGCGERGNEMTEVLTTFSELEDPKTGKPLMGRTVLIANTSNMPVAAREASVYTGITIAEYYRDMGYDVSLMADSTSRWAEAMREISSRLEEMPGEEGYPAYLASRLSEFYERCGRVNTLAGPTGSISVIGAVSPSGGDFSEPVTQNTLRIVKVFWALDSKLRERRHFPAINWLTSYSLYSPMLEEWYRRNVAEDWSPLRLWAMETLQKESELQEVVQLVGSDALPEEQRLTLEVARMIREFFLQQSAYHAVDTYSPLKRQYEYMNAIRRFSDLSKKAISLEVPLDKIVALKVRADLGKLKFEETIDADLKTILGEMDRQFAGLGV
ncbi:MAG: V/A-type H+/Na+-transporting ATPase subunit [Candidatus Thermoplasmatota archaeon]|nr:V/A-type H+/Na+-transporting ATPase subunit [Candidatus Thermoplasmatota archaeon]